MNPFLNDVEQYQRNYNLKHASVSQIAKMISSQLNIDFDKAAQFVLDKMNETGGDFELKSPRMMRLRKVARGTREIEETDFLDYIDEANEQNLIISPSLVTYTPPDVLKSVTAVWLDENIELRRKAKTKMFVLKQAGDITGSQLSDYDQNAKKIRINTVSGMRGFKGNPLYLATGHSSLTSTCRAAAGYGNATVERFIAGARHYHSPEIAKANILTVITSESKSDFEQVIEKYNLTYPSVDQVMSLIQLSTDMYWQIPVSLKEIRDLVSSITPLERAIYCYSGDFYHVAQFNPEFARQFVSDMIVEDISTIGDVDTDDILKTIGKTEQVYINSLCADILMGKTHDDVKANDPEGWKAIGKTAKKVSETLATYADFINTFFAPACLPPTVANIKSIQRRVALTADTDSSIFTTQYWVEWYTGSLKRTTSGDRVWYLMTYMGCQCIAHSLAMLSANMGVERKSIFRLSMKNEYGFPQFALTSAAKHYFCTMSIREGNVFENAELDVKGVGLRGSEFPPLTLKRADAMMSEILDTVNRGEKVDEEELLERIAGYEKETVDSIISGNYDYLKSGSVKPDTVNMIHYSFWESVMAPKYGKSIEPPFPTVNINTILNNKTDINDYIKSLALKDPAMANRFETWIEHYKRNDFKSIRLPSMAIRSCGIPKELLPIIDFRKIIFQVNKPFYMILETLGLDIVDREHYRLVSEYLDRPLIPE